MGLLFRNQEKAQSICNLDICPLAQKFAALDGEKCEGAVHSIREIGEHFGMQGSAISQLSRRFVETIKENQELRKALAKIEKEELLNVAVCPLFLKPGLTPFPQTAIVKAEQCSTQQLGNSGAEMKKYFLSILVFSILLPVYVLAGEYVLVNGGGIEVCEAYKNNLNSFNLHNEYAMACGRKINPKFTDFKKPKWEELNIWENRELLKKIENVLGLGRSFGDPDKNPQEWESILKERMTGMYATTIKISQIDINNAGKKENLIEYNYGSCPSGNYYGAVLLVLNHSRNEIDVNETKPLLQNPGYLKDGPLSEGWEFAMYDVFVYKGVTYFDRWSGNQWPGGEVGKENLKLLKVFVAKANKAGNVDTKEICEYRFRSSK